MARFGSGEYRQASGGNDKRDSLMTHYNEIQGITSSNETENSRYAMGKMGSGNLSKKIKTTGVSGGSDNFSSVGRDDRVRVKLRPSDGK